MAARTFITDSGGTARRVSRWFAVDSGGTARLASRVFVIDSGGNPRLIYSGVGPVSLHDQTVTSTDSAPNNVSSTFQLSNLGGGSQTWLNSGSASDYECFASLVSGIADSGPIGSWVSLGTTREWVKSRSGIAGAGTSTVVLSVSIRRASDAEVLATATITINAVLT